MIPQFFYMDLNSDIIKANPNLDLYVDCTGTTVQKEDFTYHQPAGITDYHMLFLCSGELELKIEKRSYMIKSGQLIIISPNTPYFYASTNRSRPEYIWVNFTGYKVSQLLDSAHLPVNQPYSITYPDRIYDAFESFFDEFRYRPELYKVAVPYKFVRILVLFGRAKEDIPRKETGSFLNHALLYINVHYPKNITTELLAKEENMSCAHFRRLFRKKTGMTPTQYITLLRLKHAERMLAETKLNVKEIAHKVGFSDQLYFSKVFSKHFGVSPSEFRNR